MTYFVKHYYTNAKKQVGINGLKYDSKFEANYANELELRKKAGDIINYESQVNIPLIVNNYEVCTYRVDFIVYHYKLTEYIETKGYWTDTAKLKWKLFEALFTKEGNLLTVIQQGKQKRPKLRKVK